MLWSFNLEALWYDIVPNGNVCLVIHVSEYNGLEFRWIGLHHVYLEPIHSHFVHGRLGNGCTTCNQSVTDYGCILKQILQYSYRM